MQNASTFLKTYKHSKLNEKNGKYVKKSFEKNSAASPNKNLK